MKFDVVNPETVSAPDEFDRPEPSKLEKDEPLTIRFVVEADVKEAYVVLE